MIRVLTARSCSYNVACSTKAASDLIQGDVVARTDTSFGLVLFVDKLQVPAVHVLFLDGSIETFSAGASIRVLSGLTNPGA